MPLNYVEVAAATRNKEDKLMDELTDAKIYELVP